MISFRNMFKVFRTKEICLFFSRFSSDWKKSSNFYNDATNKLLYGPARKVRSKKRIAKTLEQPDSENHFVERLHGNSSPSQTLLDEVYGPVIMNEQTLEPHSSIWTEDDYSSLYNAQKDFPSETPVGEGILKVKRSYKYPSVTKILDASMSADRRTALFFWEQKMIRDLGIPGFAKYKSGLLQRGSRFHAIIDEHFRGTQNIGEEWESQSEDPIVVNQIHSLQSVIHHFDSPIALESGVQHDIEGYMGVVDFFGRFKKTGDYVVVDWKTSDKKKDTLMKTFDNPVQVSAYVGAIHHDSNYTVKPHSGLIVIAYNDGSPADILEMSQNALEYYWREWKIRLHIHRKLIS